MICAYSTPRSLPTQPCDMCLTADWELLSAAWSAIISRQMSICQRFNSTCQPLDQRLLAARSTSVNDFISWKDSDAGKDWRQEKKGMDRGWDGWMASPTQWTWVWVNFGSWWCTGRPGVLQSLGSQRVRHDWTTELNWQPQTNSFNHVRLRFSSWVVSSLSLQIWELPQRKKHIHVDLI